MRSHTRSFLLAFGWLIATLVAAVPSGAQLLRYDGRPGEARAYARTQIDHVTQTVNGTDQTMDLESFWRFSTTVLETGTDALTLSVIHDSIAITGMPADSPPDFSSLYGKPVTMVMGKRGDIRSITPPESVELVRSRVR